jgi:excisionase family DNA binding protein
MMLKDPLLMKSSEAAARLGVSLTTLHRWVRSGKIECIRIEKNSVFFTQDALEEFVHKHRKKYRPQSAV